jgi:NAD(P) transhydrogenase subunit alpha
MTEAGKQIVVNNVTVSGIQNIPGRMPEHATWLYAENLYRYVENLLQHGGVIDLKDELVASTLVTMDRKIHFKPALAAMREA